MAAFDTEIALREKEAAAYANERAESEPKLAASNKLIHCHNAMLLTIL